MKPTREQIIAEPAGDQMDAWVAVYVLDLPFRILENARCPYCDEEMRFCGERSWCSNCHEWRYSPYMEYSTDIAAAWEVEERMLELGLASTYAMILNELANSGWFDGVRLPQRWQLAHATPLERCRAALLAVLDEKG